MVVNMGIVGIIIGENKKERLEEPNSSNGKMGRKNKLNHPDDEPAE